jgi:hypothetical protein
MGMRKKKKGQISLGLLYVFYYGPTNARIYGFPHKSWEITDEETSPSINSKNVVKNVI